MKILQDELNVSVSTYVLDNSTIIVDMVALNASIFSSSSVVLPFSSLLYFDKSTKGLSSIKSLLLSIIACNCATLNTLIFSVTNTS